MSATGLAYYERVRVSFIEQELLFFYENVHVSRVSARAEDFIGRRWLYRQVEDAFKDDSIGWVLIIGNPGTGKSAWASQLICSRTTSSVPFTPTFSVTNCVSTQTKTHKWQESLFEI